jgi:hypothetical protein
MFNSIISAHPGSVWWRTKPSLNPGNRPKERSQSRIEHLVKQLFSENVIINYPLRMEGYKPLELDVYISSLALAFEYQGEQHYKPSIFGNMDAVRVQQERVVLFLHHDVLIDPFTGYKKETTL